MRRTERLLRDGAHNRRATVVANGAVLTLPETSFAAMADFLKPVLKLRGIPVA